MTTIRSGFVLLSLLAATACGGDRPARPPVTSTGAAAGSTADAMGTKEAQQLFESLCWTCHGSSGHGDGPGAAAIEPKPRSFADAAWQDSVTDEHIQKVIVFGGAAVGKSPFMPAQPQLKGKTATLAALTKIVRDFRGK